MKLDSSMRSIYDMTIKIIILLVEFVIFRICELKKLLARQ